MQAMDAIFLDQAMDALFLDSQTMDAIFLDRPVYGISIVTQAGSRKKKLPYGNVPPFSWALLSSACWQLCMPQPGLSIQECGILAQPSSFKEWPNQAMDAIFLDRQVMDAIFLDRWAMDAIFLDRRVMDAIILDRRVMDAIFLDRRAMDAIFLDGCHILG